MNEAPETCLLCPNRSADDMRTRPNQFPDCRHAAGITYHEMYTTFNPKKTQHPGESCPFVRLDATKKREDEFWEFLPELYEIETREELEAEAKNWNPPNPLVVALHYIWKRKSLTKEQL